MKSPKKKDMSFFQAVKYHQLEPYGDADKDSVPNMFDCRPFDPDKHFLKFSDLKQKLKFGKEKPIAKVRKPLSRAPRKSEYKAPRHVYLYVKADGRWSKVGAFKEKSNLLRRTVEQLYRKGTIEEHVVTGSPNDERKLNFGEKVTKPIIREAKRAKKHFVETAPKAVHAYQRRIGLGETAGEAKSVLGERIKRGLELKPYPLTSEELIKKSKKVAPRRVIVTEKIEDEEEYKPEEIKTEYIIPTEKETFVPKTMREPPLVLHPSEPMMEEGIEFPSGIEEPPPRPRRGMPPYSKGWAGSIGGSRPYRPVPYKSTGRIWKPERVHNPNPKIPMASIFQFKPPENKPPEEYYDLRPKMPVTTFKFLR